MSAVCGEHSPSKILVNTLNGADIQLKITLIMVDKWQIPTSTWPKYHHSQQSGTSAQNSNEFYWKKNNYHLFRYI